MKTKWSLTKESFEALLAWLDANPEAAAVKYEQIRTRLIKIFACRGCSEPEDLADATIDRVARRLPEIEPTFVGEPARYFYGVANKIHLEYMRRKPPPPLPPPPPPDEDEDQNERQYECLDRCLSKLTTNNREMFVEYHREQGQAKIAHRRHLAEKFGFAMNALRIRMCRMRATLFECVQKCVHAATA